MAGGDRGLQHVRPALAAERLRPGQGVQAPPDEQLIPAGPVLVEQQDGLPGRPGARPDPGRLDLHQRHQAVDLGLVRRELGQHPAQPDRLVAQVRPHPVIARGRRVALVEDEVDHLQDRGQPGLPFLARRVPRREPPRRRGPSWPVRSAARSSAPAARRRGRSRPCSARRAGATSARPGPAPASTGWQEMKISRSRSSSMSSATTRSKAAVPSSASASRTRPICAYLRSSSRLRRNWSIGPPLGHGHQPGARVGRHPCARPLLQGGDHGILGQFLGQADVPVGVPGQPGDEPGRLQPDHRLDRGVRLGAPHKV